MRKSKLRTLLLCLAAALLVTLLIGAGTLNRADKWVQDALFQRPRATAPEIVLIGIDEEALAALGPYGSWDRNVMASALEALAADPERLPAVVAVDTLYSGETDPAADERLAAAAEKLGCVVTATAADFGTRYDSDGSGGLTVDSYAVLGYERPYDALRQVTVQGHINAMLDLDGILRHALLYVDTPEDGRVYSMAFEVARLYLARRGETLAAPPADARGHFYVSYAGEPGAFSEGVSLAALIAGRVPADYYAGKIVLIGPYAAGLQDSYFTPIDRAQQMYGVEVQANVIQCLLEGSAKRELPELIQALVLFAVCFGALLLFLRKKPAVSGLFCLGIVILAPALSMGLYALGWISHPLWIPLAVIALYVGSIARHYIRAALERQRVTRTFERYVAPEIVRELLKEGSDALGLGGKLCRIAVMFVDIRGFTAMSERLDPEKVVYILNRYLTMTSGCVEKNRGTLDKFVGDATMAFWGAPLEQEDPVYLAARTALDIVEGAAELSAQLRDEIGEELNVGIGVHYGPAVVGNMGSERHMDYTAIGDTVNTSARLEANAPGGTVYISRVVADMLGERAETTSLGGSVRLKGKAEGFEILTLDSLR